MTASTESVPDMVRRISREEGFAFVRETDKTVASVFAAMDDLRELAVLVRDANDDEAQLGSATMHQAANQLRRLVTQLGVEAERLDANLEYLNAGDHENANH